MRIILYVLLGMYSVGMVGYALSETFSVNACVGCFKKEKPFAGGNGTTGSDNRVVNVKYSTTGNFGFTGDNATKIERSLGQAMNRWNTATGTDGRETPFNFKLSQDQPVSNIQVQLVDKLSNPNACMSMTTQRNRDGSIKSGVLQVKKSALKNLSEEQTALLLQHELGHFIGLADNYNAGQCETIMSQTENGCKPLAKGVQAKDVSTVNKYVANPDDCFWERGVKPLHIGDGYTDPEPQPIYYPRTCYYFYEAYDIYEPYLRGGEIPDWRYVGTVYYLTDYFCY